MPKIWPYAVALWGAILVPQSVGADGVNAGLADPRVVATPGQAPLAAPTYIPDVLPGSNQVGRPGVSPDQLGGYDVNIAYDHVAVGVAIVGVLFLMTEWMENR